MNLKSYITRHRTVFLAGGAIIALIASLLSDPDKGLSTALGGLSLLQAVWAIALAFLSRKALMDYPEANQRKLFEIAAGSPTGAGLALIASAIIFVGLLAVFAPRAHAEALPPGAVKYLPALRAEQMRYWANHPDPSLLAALVDVESACPRKSSCWNPAARLKSAREEGAGFGQITRAYRSDGTIRFDALAGLRTAHPDELSEWSWGNVNTRPDLQLRALVLQSKDVAMPFRNAPAMLAFGDAAYNGGPGGVQKERRACQLTKGCDPGEWFENVETHCLKSRQPLYGNRNACDINRGHVRGVYARKGKYEVAMR